MHFLHSLAFKKVLDSYEAIVHVKINSVNAMGELPTTFVKNKLA